MKLSKENACINRNCTTKIRDVTPLCLSKASADDCNLNNKIRILIVYT